MDMLGFEQDLGKSDVVVAGGKETQLWLCDKGRLVNVHLNLSVWVSAS